MWYAFSTSKQLSDNIAGDCGGGAAVFHVNVSAHESRFINNVANSSGGALFSNESGIVNISGTDFSSIIVPQMIMVELCMC